MINDGFDIILSHENDVATEKEMMQEQIRVQAKMIENMSHEIRVLKDLIKELTCASHLKK